MPSQSRAQRRRQAANQQQQRRPQQSRPKAEAANQLEDADTVLTLDSPVAPAATPTAPSPARQPSPRATRRVLSRPAAEPVDYSKDYVAARTDLRWIAIWSGLLFAAMIALKLSGLV